MSLCGMGGLVHSQRVLLALTQAGLSREDSYALVQRNAMKVWDSDGELSLLDLLKADPEVSKRLSGEQLDDLFDLGYHLHDVDTIFGRVFGATASPCRDAPIVHVHRANPWLFSAMHRNGA